MIHTPEENFHQYVRDCLEKAKRCSLMFEKPVKIWNDNTTRNFPQMIADDLDGNYVNKN